VKIPLLTCLLLLSAHWGRGQDFDFAPEGATWNYYRTNQGIVDAMPWFYAQGDTLISGKICRKMLTPHAGVLRFYYYVDNAARKVYQWDEVTETFILDIDFSVKPGETFERTVRLESDCLVNIAYHIESIDTVVIENKAHHFFHASYTLPTDNCGYSNDLGLRGRIGCINELPSNETYKSATYSTLYGYTGSMIPISVSAHANYGLLSYQDATIAYTTNCQLYPTVNRNIQDNPSSFSIKHTSESIRVEAPEAIGTLSIINSQGQVVYSKKGLVTNHFEIAKERIGNGVFLLIVNNSAKRIVLW
jgi:hypothetical protein